MKASRPTKSAIRIAIFLSLTLHLPATATSATTEDLSKAEEFPVRKIALVIGNRDYKYLPRLDNGISDAELISKRLSSLQFDVVVRTNIDYDEIIREFKDLRNRAIQAEGHGVRPLAVFYFSGHGFVTSSRQFLTGIDTPSTGIDAVLTRSAAITTLADDVASKAFLVSFIDACRSDLGLGRSSGAGGVSDTSDYPTAVSANTGLGSRRNVQPGDNYQTYLIGFANKLGEPVTGSVSWSDANSPYTKFLNQHIGSGFDVTHELGRTSNDLRRLLPTYSPESVSNLEGDVFLDFPPATLTEMHSDWSKAIQNPTEQTMTDFKLEYLNGPLAYKADEWIKARQN